MDKQSLILIDPLVGFCKPAGTLAKKYGEIELAEIKRVIPKISQAVATVKRAHLVKSEYEIGQFTDGNLNDELSNLCVHGINEDCEIIEDLSSLEFQSLTTKHDENALVSKEFVGAIDDDIKHGVEKFVVAGFLLEHCLKATAEKLREYIPCRKVRVVICADLSASRLEKYQNGVVKKAMASLKKNGVEFENWGSV